MDGDMGEGGRPRVKEEIKLPPQYEGVNLNDPDQEVLFQGELIRYKQGYTAIFLTRWVQVTETAFRVFKNRGQALTYGKNPLLAVPVAAFKKIERVNFTEQLNPKDQKKFEQFLGN